MNPSILKQGLAERTKTRMPPAPVAPSGRGVFWAILALCAIAAITAFSLTALADASPATRTALYQARLMMAGDNPLVGVHSNVPFGHVFAQPITSVQGWAAHHAFAWFGMHAFQALALVGSIALTGGLMALSSSLRTPHHSLGASWLASASATTIIVLSALDHHTLPPFWGLDALGIGITTLGLACALRTQTPYALLAGLCAGVGVVVAPWILPLSIIIGVALAKTTRPTRRQAATIGLAAGGLLALITGAWLGAVLIWATAALGIIASMGGRFGRRWLWGLGGVALLLIAPFAAAVVMGRTTTSLNATPWASLSLSPAIAISTVGGVLSLLLASALIVRASREGTLRARIEAWWPAALVIVAALSWWALPGQASALSTVALVVHAPQLAAGAYLALQAVLLLAFAGITISSSGSNLDLTSTDTTSWASDACDPDLVETIIADLAGMQARRVLAEPVVGWQIVMGGASAGFISIGLTPSAGADKGSGDGSAAQQDDAAHQALNDTTATATTARSLANRHSIDAIVVCNGSTIPTSLKARLWSGSSTGMDSLSEWLEPIVEKEGYVIHRIVR